MLGTVEALSFALSDGAELEMVLSDIDSLQLGLETPGEYIGESYGGPYEVTPTAEIQTLETAHRLMTENTVINPIPNNYGLITWNGSVLTVS